MDCIFCSIEEKRIVHQSDLFLVIRDLFPVSYLHSLFIPKRHFEDYFQMTESENAALFNLIRDENTSIVKLDLTISGFNIGMNCVAVSGQTIFHCHIHLISHREGDTADPRGNVRGVIPDMQKY